MINTFDNNAFYPSHDGNVDEYEINYGEIKSYLSSKILLDELAEQVEVGNLSEKPQDIFNILEERYYLMADKYMNNIDVMYNIKSLRYTNFISFLETMDEEFGIGTDINIETALPDDIVKVSLAIYKIFILEYKQRIVSFFATTILKQKTELYNQFKNPSTPGYKEAKDKELFTILYNIDLIMETYNEFQCDELFKYYVWNEEEFHNIVLADMFNMGKLFVTAKFTRRLINEPLMNESFRNEIANDIKYFLINTKPTY